jgi:hypothetical protein
MGKYKLMSGDIAVGSSKLYLDIFNANTSGQVIKVTGIYVRPQSDVVATGLVAIRHNVLLTTAIGTSGTTIGYASSSETAATIVPMDSDEIAIPTGITARVAPTGGATIAARLATNHTLPEETNAAQTIGQHFNVLKDGQIIIIRPNRGLLIKQGSVASVGVCEIDIYFTVEDNR